MRHVGLSALLLSVCLLSVGSAQAAVYGWDAGGGADTNWTTGTNWSPDLAGEPLATDDVQFNRLAWGSTTVTLPNGVTTVNSIYFGTFYAYTFANAAATLDVTGAFEYDTWWIYGPTTINPVVNITGLLGTYVQTTYPSSWPFPGNLVDFTNNGNTVSGGIRVGMNEICFAGNDNTINGGIVVNGFRWSNFRNAGNFNESANAGVLYFGGTGNVFGAQTITLNSLGIMDLAQNTDLSNITAINFNGGFLRLQGESNTFSALPGGFNVKGGTLWMATDSSLGDPALNSVSLGDTNLYGMLAGYTWDNTDQDLNRPLTLNGNGGFIRAEVEQFDFAGYNRLYIGSTISGAGELIKIGTAETALTNNGVLTLTPNTYAGGTTVAGGTLRVESNRTLGTGNVQVLFGQTTLHLTAAGQVDPSATVLVKKSDLDFRSILDIQGDFLPTLDPASDGILRIYQSGPADGSALCTALGAGIAGDGTNGNLWLGGQNWSAYYGTTLAAGAPLPDGTLPAYRFSSDAYNMEAQLYVANAVLVGDTDVIVNRGGVTLGGANTFTGTLIARDTLSNPSWCAPFWGDRNTVIGMNGVAQTSGSPFGAATGDVKLLNGEIGLTGIAGGVPVVKHDLSFDGTGNVQLNGGTGNVLTELTFDSLTRVNRGNLTLVPGAYEASAWVYDTSVLGAGNLKVRVNGTVPTDSGIVSPYIVEASGGNSGDFLTYDPTNGFTTATYVGLPASPGAGTEIVSTGATALSGDVSVAALKATGAITGSGTVTIASGGLILTGAGFVQHTANFKFGAAGDKEAVIFANGDGGWFYNTPELDGQIITTGGLTKIGPGPLRLGPASTGGNTPDRTATLFGDIYVNQGFLAVTDEKELGALTNNIHLNGGELIVPYNTGRYVSVSAGRTIFVGANGGAMSSDYSGSWNIYAPFADEVAGHSGPVDLSNGVNLYNSSPAFSGGTIISWGGVGLAAADKPLGTGPIQIISQGTLFVTAPATVDQSSSRVTIDSAANLQLAYSGIMIGSLEGDGTVTIGNGIDGGNPDGLPLKFGYDNTNADFYGTIENLDCRGPGSLTKVGTGIQTFWGTISMHGATTVNGGTLRINGDMTGGQTAIGAVTVNNTATLDGKGTINAPVTVNAGGTLAGSLHVAGSVNLAGGSANLNGATIDGAFSAGGAGTASLTNTTLGNGLSFSIPITVSNATVNGAFTMYGGSYSGSSTVSTGANYFEVDAGALGGAHTIDSPVVLLEGGTFTGTNNVTIQNLGWGYEGFYLNGYGGDSGGAVTGTGAIQGTVYAYGGSFGGTYSITGDVWVGDYNGDGSHPFFQGNHTIHGALTTGANATVAPHNGATAGTMTVVGNVALDHSTTLNFNLGQVGTVGGGINDLIAITGDLSLDGTLNVTALTNFGPGTYTLFTYTGALTEPNGNLTLGTMPGGGYTYSFTSGTLHSGSVTTYEINLSVVMPYAPGDTNRDGAVNSLDIDAIYKHFNADPSSQWKVATDGLPVGQQDVTYELHTFFGTNYADANLDTKTDFVDFQVLLDHWQASGPNIGWAQGDFDGSGSVDFLDFQKLLDYWNPGGWHFAPAQAPEPATLSLLALGGLALLRRKK